MPYDSAMTSLRTLGLIALSSLCCTSAKTAQPSTPTAGPESEPSNEAAIAARADDGNSATDSVGIHTIKTLEGAKLIANSSQGPAFQITAAGSSVTVFDAGADFPAFNVDGQVVLVSFTDREKFAQEPAAAGIMLAQHFKWESEHFEKTMADSVVPPGKLHFAREKCGVVCGDWALEPAPGSSVPRHLATSIALPTGVLVLTTPVTSENTSDDDLRAVLYRIAKTLQTQPSPFDLQKISDAERARDPAQRPAP